MLNIKPYTRIEVSDPDPAPSPRWVKMWHGYYYPREAPQYKWPEPTDYSYLELMGFLSILEYCHGRHFNFFELGAGIAHWCMTLAAILKYNVIPKRPTSYRALAVEADATHFGLAKECVESQKVNATVIHKAVTNEVGTGLFSTENPYQRWGQHLYHAHMKDSVRVQTTTVDQLVSEYGFPDIQLVHMDVQAEEVKVIEGAWETIQSGLIQHFIIEVHDRRGAWTLGERLKALLASRYNLIADLPRYTTQEYNGFPEPVWGDAGIQIWQLKGL